MTKVSESKEFLQRLRAALDRAYEDAETVLSPEWRKNRITKDTLARLLRFAREDRAKQLRCMQTVADRLVEIARDLEKIGARDYPRELFKLARDLNQRASG